MIKKSNTRKYTPGERHKGGRVTRGYETAEDARQRALIDAKGLIMRHGRTYTVEGVTEWCKRRAIGGRTDQVEIVLDGVVVVRTGNTKLRNQWRFLQ